MRLYLTATVLACALFACNSTDDSPENLDPLRDSTMGEDSSEESASGPTDTDSAQADSENPDSGVNNEYISSVDDPTETDSLDDALSSFETSSSSSTPTTPVSTPAYQDELNFADEAKRESLLEQRGRVIAQSYVDVGNERLDVSDLSGALEAFSEALQLAPNHPAANEGMRLVRTLMGDQYAGADAAFEEAAARESVRLAQARLVAQDASTAAEAALAAGDFETAVAKFREAELSLRYHPSIATDSLDERLIRERLNTTLELQAEEQRRTDDRIRQEAQADQQRVESELANQREEGLRTLYANAHDAYLARDFTRAEDLASQILLLDPGNESATELREIAQSARHSRVDRENQRRLREEWIKTMDNLRDLAVPQTDAIEYDLERWSEIESKQPITFTEQDVSGSQSRQAILDRLNDVQVEAHFGTDDEGAPLDEVAAFLQSISGINFMISSAVADDLDEDTTAQSLDLPLRSVRKILDIIAETTEGLSWKVEDGIVKIVTDEELRGGQVLRMYEVRDLIHPVPDFPGREINIAPSGGIEPADEEVEEREALVVTLSALEDLITSTIDPDSWDADTATSLRITESGTLVVNQTPEAHEQIDSLLNDLREATGIMVNIQARFLKVEDNFLEDIGVDFRGLGAPGLGDNNFFNDFGDASTQQDLGNEIGQGTDTGAFYDDGQDGDYKARIENLYSSDLGTENVLTNSGGLSFQWTYLNDLQLEMILRAVSKSSRVELVTAPNLLVFNTTRANLTVLNQIAYVQDYDVEIAQGASIADPMIGVIQDGVILDVRPVVSADRRFITIEMRPTVAELQRPIPEFATSLGSQNTVTIQLPEVEISRVRTSVPIPDGGTVLLGGLKIHEQRDQQSGVPILNKIPIVRFLFNRTGTFTSNRKLLILLKASIVIPQEHEPSSAQLIR